MSNYSFIGASVKAENITYIGEVEYNDTIDKPNELTTKEYVDAVGQATGGAALLALATHAGENTQSNDPHNLATQIDTGIINVEQINASAVYTSVELTTPSIATAGTLNIQASNQIDINSLGGNVVVNNSNTFNNAGELSNNSLKTANIFINNTDLISQTNDITEGTNLTISTSSGGVVPRGVNFQISDLNSFRIKDKPALGIPAPLVEINRTHGIRTNIIKGLDTSIQIQGDNASPVSITNNGNFFEFNPDGSFVAPSINMANGSNNALGNITANSLIIDGGNMAIDTAQGKMRLDSDVNMCIDVTNTNRMLCLQNGTQDKLCVSSMGVTVKGRDVGGSNPMSITTIPQGNNNPQSLVFGTNPVNGQNTSGNIEFDVGESGNPQMIIGDIAITLAKQTTVNDVLTVRHTDANMLILDEPTAQGASAQLNISAGGGLSVMSTINTPATYLNDSFTGDTVIYNGTSSRNILFGCGPGNSELAITSGEIICNTNLVASSINGKIPVSSVNGIPADVAGNVTITASGGGGALAYIYLTKAIAQSINPSTVTAITGYTLLANLAPAGQPAAFTSNGTTVSILVSGVYSIVAEGGWGVNTTGVQRETWIGIDGNNGGNRYGWNRTPPGVEFINYVCTTVIPLNAGQTVSILVGHDATTNVDFGANALPPTIIEWSITRIL